MYSRVKFCKELLNVLTVLSAWNKAPALLRLGVKKKKKNQWCLVSSVCMAVEQTIRLFDGCMIDCSLLSLLYLIKWKRFHTARFMLGCSYCNIVITIIFRFKSRLWSMRALFCYESTFFRFAIASGYSKECSKFCSGAVSGLANV